MHTSHQYPALRASVTLFGSALIWFVGACVWFANSNSKDGWSTTPLLWMLVLTVTPVLCILSGVAVIVTCSRSRFMWFHRIALLAGAVAVTVGGWLIIGVLGSLRGMGIL